MGCAVCFIERSPLIVEACAASDGASGLEGKLQVQYKRFVCYRSLTFQAAFAAWAWTCSVVSTVSDLSLSPAFTRAGLFGCVVQFAYSPLSTRSIVMHCSTGHTCMHRLQPTHSESITSKCRT